MRPIISIESLGNSYDKKEESKNDFTILYQLFPYFTILHGNYPFYIIYSDIYVTNHAST